MKKTKTNLTVRDAVRVKSADAWLRLGKPKQALKVLQHLGRRAWTNPWTENVVWRAAKAVG